MEKNYITLLSSTWLPEKKNQLYFKIYYFLLFNVIAFYY